MNHFYFESQGRQKIKNLMNEGMRSQAYHRSRASKANPRLMLPKLILLVLGILGILQMVVR